MVNNDELVLEIMKKTGLSEKEFWSMVRNKMAKGISEDGAIKMIAGEKGIFHHSKTKKSRKPSVTLVKTKCEEKDISSLVEGDKAIVRAAIVQVFENKHIFFYACPQCGKAVKGEYCKTHSNLVPQISMKLSCILDDGTGNIRAILFANTLQMIMNMTTEDAKQIYDKNGFKALLDDISVGKDFMFLGNIHLNSFFNKNEMVVGNVKNVSVLEEIDKLQKVVSRVG